MKWNNIQWKLRKLMFRCNKILYGKIDEDVSIFCNNCIGAFVAHDLGLPFNSPMVNLMIPPADFIDYISNLEDYVNATIEPIESEHKWPVGTIGGKIYINFIHYKSLEEGIKAWRRREKRINKDKMYLILVETDGCTYEDLERFDKLPYPNKVALTHIPYPQIKCSFCVKGYMDKDGVYDSYRFHKILPLRQYDQFSWFKFFKHKNR